MNGVKAPLPKTTISSYHGDSRLKERCQMIVEKTGLSGKGTDYHFWPIHSLEEGTVWRKTVRPYSFRTK